MVIILGVSVVALQRVLVFSEFKDLESHYAKVNVDRIANGLQIKLDQLDSIVYDWSAWSATFQFVTDRNQTYIDENLYPETFENYGINIALFTNIDIESQWVGIYDFVYGDESIDHADDRVASLLLLAKEFAKKIDFSLHVNDQSHHAITLFYDEPFMFVMRPIYESNYVGSHNGFVLYGVSLSNPALEKLQRDVALDFHISEVLDQKSLLSHPDYWLDESDANKTQIRRPFIVENSQGASGFLIMMDVDKQITDVGLSITRHAILSFVVIAFMIMLIITFWLRRNVIFPISDLKNRIIAMTSDQDYSQRLPVYSTDEIGQLAQYFNALMETVEQKSSELQRTNAQLNTEHVRLMAVQDSLKKANIELKGLAEKDSLTGLYNRIAMDRKLVRDWNDMRRRKEPLTIMMIDIDHFKIFNDHFGHQAGDECIRRVSDIISSLARRANDMAVRFGGEEFMLILPNVSLEEAEQIALKLLHKVKAEGIYHPSSLHGGLLSVSAGVASVIPDASSSVRSLINKADLALYQAKEEGRNKVCVDHPKK